MVPNQLSAFPLFGGSGVPSMHSHGTEPTEEDLMAWQPVFSSSMAISPRGANVVPGVLGAPHLGFVPGSLFGASSLLSPRTMMADTMIDPMGLDMARTTLIPRLNLDAINSHPTGALFTAANGPASASSNASTIVGTGPPSSTSYFEFAAPLSPSTVSSGRLSRLSSSSALRANGSIGHSLSSSAYSLSSLSQPSLSIGSQHAANAQNGNTLPSANSPPQRRYTYGGPSSSTSQSPIPASNSISPRGLRVKSARESSNPTDGSDALAPVSPLTSARGKRRRSIYEEEAEEPESDEEENPQGDFIGTYVPTVSSARQKKKRALASGSNPDSPQ